MWHKQTRRQSNTCNNNNNSSGKSKCQSQWQSQSQSQSKIPSPQPPPFMAHMCAADDRPARDGDRGTRLWMGVVFGLGLVLVLRLGLGHVMEGHGEQEHGKRTPKR